MLFISAIWCLINDFSQPDKNRAERYFERDKKYILLVTEYLANSEYQVISIKNSDGFMYVGYDTRIEDENVVKAIKHLLDKRKYIAIEKVDNTIYFLKWKRLSDFESGIAYSINKKYEPQLPYLTKLEELSEKGWYYYESDYNEWKKSNQVLNIKKLI